MSIYRGTGGSSTTTDETTINAVNQKAAEAATSATDAASSASSASTSASNSATSASQAATSATNAATSASQALQSKNTAGTSATAAQAAQVAAEAAQVEAESAKDTAVTYGSNAVSANTTAQAAKTAAETARDVAKGYRDEVLSANNTAAASATSASTSATAAASSETNAAISETNAAISATNASSSETNAAASADNAAASETNAAASETAAATSETNAASSATAAALSASSASTSATTATTKASEAATSATNAATSEINAASSESAAATSATAASAAKDAALAALDSFDDRYLGVKSSDPTLDNDGNALANGALYFNDVSDVMKVYDGSNWLAAYADLSGALIATSNLSDLTNVAAARTNLGLGTAATTASTDYATAAQGALADSALQSFTETDPVFTAWDKSTGISITESQISDFGSYQPSGSYAAAVHGHAISDVTGLQTALDGKVDDSQVLTNVPSGAVFTDTTYSVGDGGLTEINFTSARSSKLNGIEAGATADQTITAGSGLSGGGTGNVTLSHADTSSQSSVNNSGTTFIQDITLDTYGHVTGIGSASVTIPDFVPSGTAMLFQQTSAPTGWTKSTTHNDKALRVVSGTASSGGTTAFSTAMGTPSVSGSVGISGEPAVGNLAVSMSGNISNTTLSVNTIPSHSHTVGVVYWNGNSSTSSNRPELAGSNDVYRNPATSNTGNSGAHGHSHNLSGVLNGAPSVGNLAGSLSSATAAINVQYVDIIIATKD